MRRLLITALAWMLAATPALAQVPYFPQTLPPNTVVGNPLATPAPTQAITFSNLASSLTPGPLISARTYGTIGNGVADDTVALQAAINGAANNTLFLPPGNYKISSALNVTSPITIIGAGAAFTAIIQSNTAAHIFNVTTTFQCTFRAFSLNASGIQTAGAGFLMNPASGENALSQFEDLEFNNLFNGIDFERASQWHIDRSMFIGSINPDIIVRNLNTGDSGDSTISNSQFSGLATPVNSNQVGVYQESSGGLRIIGNKFNQKFYGYQLNAQLQTGNLQIVGNSIENYNIGVLLSTFANGSNLWARIVVSDNQFTGLANSAAVQIQSNAGTPTATWLEGVVVASNNITLFANNSIGVKVDYSTNVMVEGNYISNFNANTGNTAIQVTANAVNAYITKNYANMHSAGTYLTNSSASTLIDDQNGLVTFSNLPSVAANGSRIFVPDGTPASHPLTGSGTGTTALRQNGAWYGL